MRFNNLLNRLGMNKIYTMLALLILTIIISLLLLLGLAFKEKKAYEILEDYLKHLQTADYNEAVKLINVDKQDNWQNEFYKFSKDSSANAQLEQKFIQNTSTATSSPVAKLVNFRFIGFFKSRIHLHT